MSKKPKKIYLASKSYRRRRLLRDYFELQLLSAEIDETPRRAEAPRAYARRMAKEKWLVAREGRKKLNAKLPLVTADTIVVFKAKILQKPANKREAKRMLEALSGKTHSVISTVAVGLAGEKRPSRLVLSESFVRFRKLEKKELQAYLNSGEWQGKAGAYGIQGSAYRFVASLKGSLTSIVGLPLEETLEAIDSV